MQVLQQIRHVYFGLHAEHQKRDRKVKGPKRCRQAERAARQETCLGVTVHDCDDGDHEYRSPQTDDLP